jgi:hypothetical protein
MVVAAGTANRQSQESSREDVDPIVDDVVRHAPAAVLDRRSIDTPNALGAAIPCARRRQRSSPKARRQPTKTLSTDTRKPTSRANTLALPPYCERRLSQHHSLRS